MLEDAKIPHPKPNQYFVYQIKLRKSDQNIKLKNKIKNDPNIIFLIQVITFMLERLVLIHTKIFKTFYRLSIWN